MFDSILNLFNLGSTFAIIIVLVGLSVLLVLLKRYQVVPSDKIIVIFGMIGGGDRRSAKCLHGGVVFVWPLIQSCRFLSLTPMTIEIPLRGALSRQNIRVNVPSRFTIGVSTDPEGMQNAAVRLLDLRPQEIQDNATDIILGQLRATIATMDIEEINADREKFERKIMENVESELRKIGLQLINVNITDISDDSGYIESLGKKSASEAINQAKVDVAEQERKGATGEAEAKREQRIAVASANAIAVEGENLALMSMAKSNAARNEVEAESKRRAEAAALVQNAKANLEGYDAERQAEEARQAREKATREANELVPAQVGRERIIVEAEAESARMQRIAEGEAKKLELLAHGEAIKIQKLSEAESIRLRNIGQGEAEATRLRMEAEAQGIRAILESRAEGFRKLVVASGQDSQAAAMLLLAEKAPELYGIQAEALKNLNIDKFTVVGGIGGQGGEGTLGKVAGEYLSLLPSLHEGAKAFGLDLPAMMGKPGAGHDASTGKAAPKREGSDSPKAEE